LLLRNFSCDYMPTVPQNYLDHLLFVAYSRPPLSLSVKITGIAEKLSILKPKIRVFVDSICTI
jgi:hypothetical protein